MPIDTTHRLDAVNLIISAIGMPPLASLSGEADDSSLAAEQQLDASDREAQSIGWWFNTYERTFALEGTDVLLPSTILYVDGPQGTRYTLRAGKLFNLLTGDSIFTAAVTLTVVEMMPFDQLPEVARGYIIAKASRRFADRQLGDPALSKFSRDDEAQAYMTLRKAHLKSGNYKIWGPSTGAAMRRGGPLDHYSR